MVRYWENRSERIIGIAMALCLLLNVTACGNGARWIFSLKGEKLYHTDVDAFGFVYAMDHNITDEGQMEELYEDGDTYEEHYKKELEDEILSSVLLQQQADEAGIQLDKQDKAECKSKAEDLVNVYGEELLRDKKLDQQDIQNIYESIRLGERYIESMTQEGNTDITEEADARYVEVYEVLFPTVMFDEDGMVLSDTDGKAEQVSDAQKETEYDRAQELVQKVTDGEEIEKAAAAYGTSVMAAKKHLKYMDLKADYKKAVDDLKEKDVSGVFEGTYGYYVIRLLQKDASEYGDQIANYEQQTKSQDARKEIVDKLYDSYVGTDKNYRNDKRWELITITDYLR